MVKNAVMFPDDETRLRDGVTRPGDVPGNAPVGATVVLELEGVDALIAGLASAGYETKGPVVREGAIVPGRLSGVADLPRGVHDDQAPGHYQLTYGDDDRLFDWAVGPESWKGEFFPPHDEVWRLSTTSGEVAVRVTAEETTPLAIIGARPCEAAALDVLDRVLQDGAYRDPRYAERRDRVFIAVTECASPSATCFCASMETGPQIDGGYDLALTELDDEKGHRFLARVGTPRGAEALAGAAWRPADEADLTARTALLEGARQRMGRHLETDGLAAALARNVEHPRWAEVAERCLSCGNCTLVCPTCFCSDVHDKTELDGDVVRERTWSSCFDVDHSYLHGGAVRPTTSSRYRQWLTHKLSTWWDQFDTTGCVGCGRCIAWCPVGIDITEEATAIVASDGATRVDVPAVRRPS